MKENLSNHKYIIRDAALDDLERVVQLHLDNFDKNELSIMLGREFVETFYRLAIQDEEVTVTVVEHERELVSSSMLFFRLDLFEHNFRSMVTYVFIKYILYNMLLLRFNNITRVFQTLFSRKISNVLDDQTYRYHIGAFMINHLYKDQPSVIINFHKMYMENIKIIKAKAEHGYWGSCRKSNRASLRLLKSGGMKSLVEIDAFPEPIIVAISEGD